MRIRKAMSALAAVVLGATLATVVATAAATADPTVMAVDDLPEPWSGTGDAVLAMGTFYIKNSATGRCLDAHADGRGANNSPVGLWECNGGASERWRVRYLTPYAYPNMSYRYYLINDMWPSKCLDYPASSGGANGWQFNIYSCLQNSGQMFRISAFNQQADGRLLSVQLGGANNVMDAFASGGGGNKNPVGNWAWTGHGLQHWRFIAE